jgi:hypothetical protein
MSLINDALKKAQKQRTGEAPSLGSMPSVGGESAASISRRAKPGGFDTLVLRAGIGAAVVLVLSVGGYFALRHTPEDRGQKTENSPTQVAATQPPAVSPPSSVLRSPSSEPAAPAGVPASPAFTLQVAPKTATTPSSVVSPPSSVASPPSSAISPPSSEASAPPKPALKLEPRALTFIDNIKVAGIRASATDSKVLMNDRVYRIGDMVEHEMGLKLVGITSNSLTFEDEKGGRYTRTF